MYQAHQLDLFNDQSLNPIHEIKRQIRLALSNSGLSRDQVVDRMNEVATKEGIRNSVSKAVLDGWAKDSDPKRMPSLTSMVVFCSVMGTAAPIAAMLRPLGCGVLNGEDLKLLLWAKAEMEKKRSVKKARLALEAIE